ncbi:uncharacterized protein N0V89_011384 [Didymosphaeria variabile]|uniref:Peptidase M12A domain-containing protein n=1 Tax=Didymosphaeria variabile TaxID=1932322 RepID=A0A9W8X9W4_9PLEO|nr:uncharacterized protein N0V89_011384 [Didymosphaeria variabile]KAJ4345254.1 hypothetical protein N0V89_011384 [Didymosphaeria variabile]
MKFLAQIIALAAMIQLLFAINSIPAGDRALPVRQAHKNSTGATGRTLPSMSNDDNPAMGYAEFISSGHVSAWPMRRGLWKIDEGYIRTIPYCFVDKRTYENIGDSGKSCKIRAAFNVWSGALNGRPSAASGHSLGFRVANDHFCCTSYRYGTENQPQTDSDFQCDWDHSRWPSDTLAIHWIDDVKASGSAGSSTTGYVRAADKEKPNRHWMRVASGATPDDIAHEFGHGMIHEHQRWDRDDHVEFRCDNLVGMWDKINTAHVAEKISPAQAHRALCEDLAMAHKYHAPSQDYIKGAGLNVNSQPRLDGPGGFDMDSIMLYDSYSSSEAGDQADIRTAVLVAIRRDANGQKIPGSETMIPHRTRPSAKDVQFVKDFYAWDEAKYQESQKKDPGAT